MSIEAGKYATLEQCDEGMKAAHSAIRPFVVDVPEREIVELRRRLAATRWPDQETVSDRRRTAGEDPGARRLLGHRLRLAQGEIYRAPKTWAERAPELFAKELRAAFRLLR